MGALRLFLAISVLLAHTTPLLGLHLLQSSTAVRIFFMISGFYMALVLSEKYAGKTALFYSNRALRLYPTYWLALAVAILVNLATAHRLFGVPADSAVVAAAIVPNLFLFGGDLLFQLQHGSQGWLCTLWANSTHDPTAGSHLLVSPAWSLGTELLFYLLAPWLVERKVRTIGAVAAASFCLQLWMDNQIRPWSSYFFFPANLCFFLYGIIGYRFTQTPLFSRLKLQFGLAVTLGALAVLFGREFIPFFRNYSWMHYTVAAVAIPFIFHQTARLQWDRRIGELSYPIYLFHAPCMVLVEHYWGAKSALWTLAITLPLSIGAMVWLEEPIERWRQRRAAAARQADDLIVNDGAARPAAPQGLPAFGTMTASPRQA